jgi:hypothetical protein
MNCKKCNELQSKNDRELLNEIIYEPNMGWAKYHYKAFKLAQNILNRLDELEKQKDKNDRL